MNTPLALDICDDDFNIDGIYVEPNDLFKLWFNFLLLSPSFELARRFRTNHGQLDPMDQARLPVDFEAVLAVYDDWGDLQQQFFRPWLRQRGIKLFGVTGEKPQTQVISKLLKNDVSRFESATSGLKQYLDTDWKRQNCPDVMLVAIPLNQPRSRILEELKVLVNSNIDCRRPPQLGKYKLNETPMHTRNLMDALNLLSLRARKPDLKLRDLGIEANSSPNYIDRLNAPPSRKTGNVLPEFATLNMMTSRKLRIAVNVAENAARGLFPEKTKPSHMLDFNPKEFHPIVTERLNWEQEEIKKYQQTDGGTPASITP